jgi:glycosyltransferase involved in cell wall biosynthesis
MASYAAVSLLHGGPRTQILGTARHLASQDIDVQLFDPWSAIGPESFDLLHLFGANIGTYHLAREVSNLALPMVVSPIVFSRHSPRVVRRRLGVAGLLHRARPGLWSDYGLTAEICRWAERVTPNTEAEAELIIRGYGIRPSAVRTIPNGVDERFAHGDPELFRKRYGLEDFVLNVGHVGPARKNTLALIQALGGIDHPSVIIGRVTRDAAGEACVREASRHRQILLFDRIENDSALLASAYAACRVFALPSLFETPGIAALEAALAGAQIVITPHGGTREYFEDMAIYVDPHSVQSIRDGIQRGLTMPRDVRLREHVQQKYLWSRVAELTAGVYREILGGTAGR